MSTVCIIGFAIFVLIDVFIFYGCCVVAGKADDELEKMGIRRS